MLDPNNDNILRLLKPCLASCDHGMLTIQSCIFATFWGLLSSVKRTWCNEWRVCFLFQVISTECLGCQVDLFSCPQITCSAICTACCAVCTHNKAVICTPYVVSNPGTAYQGYAGNRLLWSFGYLPFISILSVETAGSPSHAKQWSILPHNSWRSTWMSG